MNDNSSSPSPLSSQDSTAPALPAATGQKRTSTQTNYMEVTMNQTDLTSPTGDLRLDVAILTQANQPNPHTRGALRAMLAKRGIRTLQVQANSKIPATKHGVKDATADLALIEAQQRARPDLNIAMATGEIVVIDVDVKNGAKGLESLAALERDHGPLSGTLRVSTPTGGWHYWFHTPQAVGNRTGLRPGIDIRGQVGYVLLPGSTLEGVPYTFDNPRTPIKPLPAALLAEITAPKQKAPPIRVPAVAQALADTTLGFPEGMRNDGVFRLAASLRGRDIPLDLARTQVMMVAAACQPPLPAEEAERCLRSAYESYLPNGYRAPLTHLGNAECFVQAEGTTARFVVGLDQWLIREGDQWRPSFVGEIHQKAKAVLRARKQEDRNTNPDQIGAVTRFVLGCEKKRALDDLLALAAREPGMSIHATELDREDHLLGVKNGVLDLRSRALVTPGPDQYVTKQAGTVFDPSATCPRWKRFIKEIANGDPAWVRYIQAVLGYLLRGGNPEQRFFILNGNGANGKSTLISVVGALMGQYGVTVGPEVFMQRKGANSSGPSEDILRLRGARLAWTSEVGEGEVLNEDLVKRISGGDKLAARGVYARHTVEFDPRFTAAMITNHLPIIRGDDHGIWRRINVIPFNRTFSPQQQDKNLTTKLLRELPGILNWCLDGLAAYDQEGLKEPACVHAAVQEYRGELDLLADWLAARCVRDPKAATDTRTLHQNYLSYSEDDWVAKQVNTYAFGNKLRSHGFQPCKVKGMRGWRGLRLLTLEERTARSKAPDTSGGRR